MKLFLQLTFRQLFYFFTDAQQRAFIWLALKYSGTARYKKRQISFLNYSFQVPDTLSFIWQFKEIFTDESYRFESQTNTPLIYDCGANVGTSCAYFKRLFPQAKIRAFEADPQIAQLLAQNMKSNNISGVEISPVAVWIHKKGINLVQEGADGASVVASGASIHVPSVRLRELLLAETQPIDMLKMDIEGAETAVITDCNEALQKCRHIFIEYHSFRKHPQDLHKILNTLTTNHFRYFIKPVSTQKSPFLQAKNSQNLEMDLQLNLFAWQEGEK